MKALLISRHGNSKFRKTYSSLIRITAPMLFRSIVLMCLLLSFISAHSLAYSEEGRIRTDVAKDIDRDKNYSLILYGARHGNDLESVAILDIEGDEYVFAPYAPDFDFEIERGLDASAVIKRAEQFVSWHPLYHGSELKKIVLSGRVIGYELRPLYDPLAYGLSDVLDIDYRLRDKEVIVRIRLLPQIERMLHDGERRREER
ncbi:MAG: hypothetical protein ACK415_08020 [Thermodesulfovibrionales bacterium]